MKLIVGLGNPGKKYEHTRHNMGFDVVNLFSDISQIDIDKEVFDGVMGRGKVLGQDVILFKPYTFMNLSGHAVMQVINFFKIDISDVVIVYDDMAIPVGKIRLRLEGSSGGHKGMQHIIEQTGREDIKRIRIGIGEPEYNAIDYVLTKPNSEEKVLIEESIKMAVEALKEFLKSGFERAMSKFN